MLLLLLVSAAVSAAVAAVQFRLRAETETRGKKELETNLYFHSIALAHRELSRNRLGRGLELLNECPQNLRQWEWYYLKRLCRVDPVVLPDKAEVNCVAFSPDGELLASAGEDGIIKVWNIGTRTATQIPNAHRNGVVGVTFHPGGKHLASLGGDEEVKVWDLTTGKSVFTCPGAVGEWVANGVAFSPDGGCLAAGSKDAVVVWDWRTRQPIHTFPGQEGGINVAFSADGRRLAAGGDKDVMIWDAEKEGLHSLRHEHHVSALAFSPDSRRLVSACYDQRTATGHRNRHGKIQEKERF
jgi:WD40 repeat protein